MSIDNKSLKYLNETLNVSRETMARLEKFVALTLEWNKAINLISPVTVPDIWWRHIVDSAQIAPLIPASVRHITDLGSGGGFPAIILGVMGNYKMTLIESDQRKSIFLREAARQLGLTDFTVLTQRIEAAPPQNADLVTARALAPLDQLVAWAKPHGKHFLFPKGSHYRSEILALGDNPGLVITEHVSITDDQAAIIEIKLES